MGLLAPRRRLTDAALSPLKGMQKLKTLLLQHTCITDQGLESIEGLTTLSPARILLGHNGHVYSVSRSTFPIPWQSG
jgi:hypothetical protein